VSISKKRFVFVVAAIVSIPASVVSVIYVFGVADSLKFAWMTPYAPYFYSCIGFAVLMWLTLFVMDYVTVRSAALTKPTLPTDPEPLVKEEKQERMFAIERLSSSCNGTVQRIEQSIRDLEAKLRAEFSPKQTTEPTLKERALELANDLLTLLRKQGPEPAEPLSNKGTIVEQRQGFHAYFDWKRDTYFKYMAYFKNRVISLDYQLAASGIFTTLDDKEIDPPRTRGEVDLQKIAQSLILAANRLES
jgi:hypothetical protein